MTECNNTWQPIAEAENNEDMKTQGGWTYWLGWKPFTDENGAITSTVIPKRGAWDIGTDQWIAHWEDHGEPGGYRPMPFDPQPDYFIEGFEPLAPTT